MGSIVVCVGQGLEHPEDKNTLEHFPLPQPLTSNWVDAQRDRGCRRLACILQVCGLSLPPPLLSLLSFIAAKLTCAHSSAHSHVKGLHLNMAFISRSLYNLVPLLGQRFGRFLGYTEKDVELLYPYKEKVFYNIMRESGYMHIQATKPDTVGKHTRVVGPRGNLTAPENTAYSKKPLTREQKYLFSLLRTELRASH